MKKAKRVVLTYGSFDLFHVGHLNLIERARALGDYLVVGVSTDAFNAVKEKKSFFNYEDRARIVSSCKQVDKVIPEQNWSQKINDIRDNHVDVFVMGDDWKGKFDDLKSYCEVVYLERTAGISSTKIRMLAGVTLESTLLVELKRASQILASTVQKFEELG
jgi:glycerol-3-phosphate cytidylyltransferase